MNVLEIIIKLLVKNTLNLYFNSLKMIAINYQKRKNIELFKRFEEPTSLFLSKTQNYIPIYARFFNLNDNRPTLKIKDVFTKGGDLTKEGEQLLIKASNGYVSYVRGENPYAFPYMVTPQLYNDPKSTKKISSPI